MERIEKNIYHAPAQTKGAGAYTVKINKQGVKVNRSFYYTNSKERKLAKLQAQAYRNEEGKAILLTGQSATRTSLLTLQAVSDEYLKKKTVEKKGAVIEEARIKALQRDYPHLFNTPIEKLKRADFEKWTDDLKSKKKSNATINKEISLFSSFFKFAKQRDGQEWVSNLVEGLTLKVEKKERKNFKHLVYEDIFEATDSDTLRIAIRLGVLAGMRRSEIATLKKANILLDDIPHIKLGDTKNGDSRIIPLQPALVEQLKGIVEGLQNGDYLFRSRDNRTHIEPHSITTAFNRAKLRLIKLEKYTAEELDGFKFHNGRGRFAIDLVLNGVDILTTAKVGGWKTLSVLKEHYYNPSVEELAQKMGVK